MVYLSVINYGELVYITEREQGAFAARRAIAAVDQLPITVVEADRRLTFAAAHVKAHHRLSYADAFAVALAQQTQATLVTGDPEFRAVEHLVAVEWLPQTGRVTAGNCEAGYHPTSSCQHQFPASSCNCHMQPIKLLHTADIHIGMENYGRIDPATGINARVMDFLRRLSDIGDYAIEQGVDVFVFAGDAYKTRDPNPTHQREFARRIKKIADAGIPVIMLVGNHDLPAVAKRATSIDIFGTLDVPNVYVGNREEVIQITCRRGQPLQVATAPYPLRTALLGKEQQQGKSLSELDTALQNAMIANIGALAAQVGQRPESRRSWSATSRSTRPATAPSRTS